MPLRDIEQILRDHALQWGMVVLYLWIAVCGVYFYWRYQKAVKARRHRAWSIRNRQRALRKKLRHIRELLMESDSNAPEAERLLEDAAREAGELLREGNPDPAYGPSLLQTVSMLESAFVRRDMRDSGARLREKFLREGEFNAI